MSAVWDTAQSAIDLFMKRRRVERKDFEFPKILPIAAKVALHRDLKFRQFPRFRPGGETQCPRAAAGEHKCPYLPARGEERGGPARLRFKGGGEDFIYGWRVIAAPHPRINSTKAGKVMFIASAVEMVVVPFAAKPATARLITTRWS